VTERWVRSRRAAAIDVGADLVLLGTDGLARTVTGDGAELARAVLAWLAEPHTLAETEGHVERLAGAPDRGAVVPQLVELLAAVGAIERVATGATGGPAASRRGAGANVVLGVTGALAATHAPALVAALLQRGHTVEIALTPTATRFASVDALAAIARREPHVSIWPRALHAPVPHVALAEWADVIVVYPASATTIARIAAGDCSELVAAIAVTTRAPVVIAPSMNAAMLDAPATQRNLELLRGDGVAIVHGVPSVEAADQPAARDARTCAAPSPAELAAALDMLLAADLLARRGTAAPGTRAWDGAYRHGGGLVPWARDDCDADLAAALAEHAPSPRRVLDIGCGLGQVARHAAAAGHRVVATDVSEVALTAARTRDEGGAIVWLRDDICASALVGPFDLLVDRATLHALPRARAAAWAASLRRLAARDAIAIVKAHADDTAVTTGWTAAQLAALLPDFAVVSDHAAELPGVRDPAPIAARLVVLRRVR
jgi:3-polyprenyl-4-hydroxybenzoate decarboxylase